MLMTGFVRVLVLFWQVLGTLNSVACVAHYASAL